MAYAKRSLVEYNNTKCWRVEICELDGQTEVLTDHAFTISYFTTRNGKHYYKGFEVNRDGECLDPNIRVKKESTGVYICWWSNINDKQNVVVTT